MKTTAKKIVFSDVTILVLLGAARLALHVLTNHQYGFHRDELAMLDDANYLAWGYIAYPPFTAFIGRLALELFGPVLTGVRLLSALAQSIAMVLTGLMARELGGKILAQVVAALAAGIAPMALIMGAMFQYISFDYLWWVLIAYLIIRMLKSDDPRWWPGIGAAIGLGMMTKYTIAIFVAGIVAGVLLTSSRRHLKSPWLWIGAALSILIWLPNLVWQIQNNFISLRFLADIHARDIAIGRADGFLPMQLFVSANPFTLPLWIWGLYFYFLSPAGARYRLLGWMYLVPLVLMFAMQGRFYYLAPAYPMLLAAGAVAAVQWFRKLPERRSRLAQGVLWGSLTAGAVLGGLLMLPIAPVNSPVWNMTSEVHDNFVEQIGWPDLVAKVSDIYAGLPAEEKAATGILTGNYGEAGAIKLIRTGISFTNRDQWKQFLLDARIRRPCTTGCHCGGILPAAGGTNLYRMYMVRKYHQ